VYALYNRIFDCRGHGWSNLQSTHLNLPFANDEEFGKLHAAIRMVLPIIPALSASSPILDGKATGFLDSRMEAYLHHQEKLPELMGSLIPEAVFSQEDYYRTIFSPIAQALAPFDTEHVMDHHFANSRGAMVKGRWVSTYLQRAWSESDLLPIFLQVIKDAGKAVITNKEFLIMFGVLKQHQMTAQKLWEHLYLELRSELSEGAQGRIEHLLKHGCLSSRILGRTGKNPTPEKLREVYTELAGCLQEDRPFA
jgi:carboxylate-amine ligase